MSSPEAPKRRRGRPRKETSEGDSSLRTLREKNRYAQSMFRARKRALEGASEQRISQLEGTIERMGDTFLTLVDHVIQSNQQQNNPKLNATLHNAIQTFLTLSATSSDPNSHHHMIRDQVDIPQPIPHNNWNSENKELARSTAELKEGDAFQDASDLQPWTANDHVNTQNFLDQLGSVYSLLPGLTGSPVNVLGNGWTGDVPFPYTASLNQGVSPPAFQSISTLIVQATLYYVYYILLEATDWFSSEEASNIFGYALKLHSRDELLFNLRWFLGPGKREAYRLSKTGFQISHNQECDNIPTLSPLVDSDALTDMQAQNKYQLSTHQTLMNADGVEEYLLRHGFRRTSEDTFEVDFEESSSAYEIQKGSGAARQSDWLNTDVFFPTMSQGNNRMVTTSMQQAPKTRTVRFSEPKFMRSLVTQASHCLAYGPGYRGDRLHELIEAAAVPSPNR